MSVPSKSWTFVLDCSRDNDAGKHSHMKQVTNPSLSVVVAHDYLQHGTHSAAGHTAQGISYTLY